MRYSGLPLGVGRDRAGFAGSRTDDENALAGTDHSELPAGYFLYQGRIFPQPPCLLAERVVIRLQGSNPIRETRFLKTRHPCGQQAALADEGIRHERTGSQQQQIVNRSPGRSSSPGRWRRRRQISSQETFSPYTKQDRYT